MIRGLAARGGVDPRRYPGPVGSSTLLLRAVAALVIGSTAAAQDASPPLSWTFGDGLRLGVGDLEARVRTRIHMDLVESRLDDVGRALGEDFADGLRLRRARWLGDFAFREGSVLAGWRARAQVDFAGSEIDWKDLFVRYDGLPRPGALDAMDLRAGHFREPLGIEAMSSVSHIAFIERSTASDAFTPGRSRGVQWSGRGSAWLVQAGAFRAAEGLPFPDDLGTGRSLTLRAVHQGAERGLVQWGGGVTVRDPGEDGIRFGARPGTRLLPRVADTGTLDAERFTVGALEALWLGEGWAAVAEWFQAVGSGVAGADGAPILMGGHLSVQTFLDQGQPTWNRARGGLRAAKVPDAWSTREHGPGAVELAARLAWVDLDDGVVRGGRALDLELGVNWYLQPATRFMLHWVGARVDAPDGGEAHGAALLARLQVQL